MSHLPARREAPGAVSWLPRSDSADTTVSARVLARISASMPDSTRRAYAGDWGRFEDWCLRAGRRALPATAETLAEYASHLADQKKKPATITRALSSVRVIHQYAGEPAADSQAARAVVRAYRGERAQAGLPNSSPAAALSAEHLQQMSGALGANEVLHLRDQVLLVLGWATNRRRHVLAALNITDVAAVDNGLDITVRRDKTDQQATGKVVAAPYGSNPLTCPVRLTLAWITLLADRGITSGALLRAVDRHGVIAGQPGKAWAGRPPAPGGRMSPDSINRAVQRAGVRAGLPSGVLQALSAHSLRAGGATAAYLGGADLLSIARHGGWADGSSALYRYIRDVDRWTKNPMYRAGL